MARFLPNRPLIEALVDLKWAVGAQSGTGATVLSNLQFLTDFSRRVSEDFPSVEELPAASAPLEAVSQVPLFRFRRTRGTWPLLQVGAGVATVNFTDPYDWSLLRQESLRLFGVVDELVLKPTNRQLQSLVLQFINGVQWSAERRPLEFLGDMLHTSVTMPQPPGVSGNQGSIALTAGFNVARLPGTALLKIGTGTYKDKPAFVFDISCRTEGDGVPRDLDAFTRWIDDAHSILEGWFFSLIDGKLEKEFLGGADAVR